MSQLIAHLAFRARLDPQSIAIQTPDTTLTSRQLLHWVRAVAARLRRLGIAPGQFVQTALSDKQVDWIFILALAHEGAVSCSAPLDTPAPRAQPWDWVITNTEGKGVDPARCIRIDEAWMQAAGQEATDDIAPMPMPPGAPVRLFLTSGTTGRRKAIAMDTAQILARARAATRLPERSVSMFRMDTQPAFNACMVCLVNGLTLYAAKAQELPGLIRRHRIEVLTGSPAQVAEFAGALERHGAMLEGLKEVRLAGAAPTHSLIDLIRRRMAPEVLVHYGSTEAGGTCNWRPVPGFDTSTAGLPLPECEVQIVDAQDSVLPAGQTGRIRVRTPFLADGYLDDPQQTALSFRGGWFYPGDLGYLDEQGMLLLAGRESERMNIGGAKIDPLALDQFLLDQPGVEDAAVFEVTDTQGGKRLAVALVGAQASAKAVLETCRARFGAAMTPAFALRVAAIPRNAMGKVMRAELAEQAMASIRSA